MERLDIHKIVVNLIKDEVLIRNHRQFFHALELRQAELLQLTERFKLQAIGEYEHYELFHEAISQWVAEKGKVATLDRLCKILRDEGFYQSADTLEVAFLRVTDEFNTHDIVNVLMEDPVLILNWKRFAASLESEYSINVQLVNSFKNGTIAPYDLFMELITRWKSVKGSEATVQSLCQILEAQNFMYCSDRLRSAFVKKHYQNQPIWYEIKRVTPNFTGRSKEVEMLTKMFLQESGLVTIAGMSGVGKTELAKQFATKLFVENQVDCIFLNGESAEIFRSSVLRLADKVGVSTMGKGQSRNAVDIFLSFAELRTKIQMRMVVIIDNLDNENEDVKRLLSKLNPTYSFVIVTSRNSNVLNHVGEVIRLDVFEGAILFVQNSMPDETETDVQSLCKLMQNWPLALQQAVAFIKSQKRYGLKGQGYKINDFLNDYERNKAKVLDFPLHPIEDDNTQTTLLTTWNMTIDQIKLDGETGQLAIELLNILAFLEPDNIQIDFLCWLYQESGQTEDKILEAIELLKNYSLIKVENCQISIHRFSQQIIRVNLSQSNLEIELLRKLMKSMQGIVPTLEELEIGHIISIWRYGFKYEDLIQEFVHLPYQISSRLQELSLFKEMLDFARESEQLYEKVLGSMHSETWQMKSQIARALDVNGSFKEALQMYENVLENHKSILGDEDPQTISIMQRIGECHTSQGKFDEAKVVLQKVLDLQTKILGQSHPSTQDTQERLKDLLGRSGDVIEPTPSSPSTKLSEDLTNLAINEIEIPDIVGVLLEAEDFIQNWTRFYKGVELDDIKMFQLEVLFNSKKLTNSDLLSRVVNLWVESGKTNLQTFVLALESNGFARSAARLHEVHGDELNRIQISRDQVLSSYENLLPERAIFHSLESNNFNTRHEEITSIEKCFTEQHKTGIIEVVSITGPHLIGKSELGMDFASKLHTKSHVNCIGINGKGLESEFKEFLTECGIETDSILDLCELFRGRKWLMVFKDVDKPEDTEYLQSNILKPLRQVPPDQGPFIVVTNLEKKLNPESFRFLNVQSIELNFRNSDSLCNYMKFDVSPGILERIGESQTEFRDACSKVDRVFKLLDGDLWSDMSKCGFTMLALISYFIGFKVRTDFLMSFWTLSLKNMEDNRVFKVALDAFVKGGVLVRKGGQVTFHTEVQTVIREHYLNHPGVRSVFFKLLGWNSSKLQIHKWLIGTLISEESKLWKILAGIEDKRTFSNLLIEGLREDEIVTEFQNQFPDLHDDYWTVESLTIAYNKYIALLGQSHEHTLTIGDKLASYFSYAKRSQESGLLFKELYELKKAKFGPVHYKCLDCGNRAVIQLMGTTIAVQIAREMVNNCDLNLPVGHDEALLQMYVLANALEKFGERNEAVHISQSVLQLYSDANKPEDQLLKDVKDYLRKFATSS